MRKADLYKHVLDYLEAEMPPVDTELHYETPFQLLVAVVLSAQCTDKRVNLVTPRLFEAYPTAGDMAKATESDILEYIKSVSYPNSKAKYLRGLSVKLAEQYGGELPREMEQLVALPGVGRKTANVVLALVFKEAALAVDTHVYRVSHRLGLVSQRCKTPLSVELELKKHIAHEKVAQSHFWLLYHGRYTCTALRPKCTKCGLTDVCRYFQTKKD